MVHKRNKNNKGSKGGKCSKSGKIDRRKLTKANRSTVSEGTDSESFDLLQQLNLDVEDELECPSLADSSLSLTNSSLMDSINIIDTNDTIDIGDIDDIVQTTSDEPTNNIEYYDIRDCKDTLATFKQFVENADGQSDDIIIQFDQPLDRKSVTRLSLYGKMYGVIFDVTDVNCLFDKYSTNSLVHLLSNVCMFHYVGYWDNLAGTLYKLKVEDYTFPNIESMQINNIQTLREDQCRLLVGIFPGLKTIIYHDYTLNVEPSLASQIVQISRNKLEAFALENNIQLLVINQ